MKNINLNQKNLVSIIIRTKNEEDWIESCIESIYFQSYKNIEIIIIDNYSKDNTLKKINKYKVKVSKIKKFFPGKAINQGVKLSRGEIIICLSAHCIPKNKRWLENLIKPLINNKKIKAVYGRQEPYSYSSALDKRDLLTTFGLDKIIQKKDPFFHNANSAFLKSIWKKYPFDELVTNVEDRLWGKTLIDNKHYIQYQPEASVYHWHGINHSQNAERAESIIKILENKNNFFSYQNKQTKNKNLKGIAIIPLKGEDLKNFNDLNNTLNTLRDIKDLSKVYVSTDDKKIYDYVINKGFNSTLRPKILSNSFTDIFDVAKYTIKKNSKNLKNLGFVLIVQTDYPNRDDKLLLKMITKYKKNNFNSLVAAKIERRSYEVYKTKGSKKQLSYLNLIPQNLKDDKLIIFLTGLGTIIDIDRILNDSWRYSNIDYFEVSDIYSIKSNTKSKVKN